MCGQWACHNLVGTTSPALAMTTAPSGTAHATQSARYRIGTPTARLVCLLVICVRATLGSLESDCLASVHYT